MKRSIPQNNWCRGHYRPDSAWVSVFSVRVPTWPTREREIPHDAVSKQPRCTIGVGAVAGGTIGLTADSTKSADRTDAGLAAFSTLNTRESAIGADVPEDWPNSLEDAVHGPNVELHLGRLWGRNVTITTRLADTGSC